MKSWINSTVSVQTIQSYNKKLEYLGDTILQTVDRGKNWSWCNAAGDGSGLPSCGRARRAAAAALERKRREDNRFKPWRKIVAR